MDFTRRISLLTLAAVFLLFVGGAISAQQIEAKIRNELTAVNQDLMKTYAAGDGISVGSFYAENGQLLQPNGKTISGREAIGKYWQAAID